MEARWGWPARNDSVLSGVRRGVIPQVFNAQNSHRPQLYELVAYWLVLPVSHQIHSTNQLSGRIWTHLARAENVLPAPLFFEAVIPNSPFPSRRHTDRMKRSAAGGSTIPFSTQPPLPGGRPRLLNPTTQPVRINMGHVSRSPSSQPAREDSTRGE